MGLGQGISLSKQGERFNSSIRLQDVLILETLGYRLSSSFVFVFICEPLGLLLLYAILFGNKTSSLVYQREKGK